MSTTKLTTVPLTFFAAIYFMVVFNHPALSVIANSHLQGRAYDYLFIFSAVLVVVIIINLIISLFAFKYIFKPWIIFLLIGAPCAAYYMETYHILINREMMRNLMGTDYKEASGLFSWTLVSKVVVTGFLPCIGIIATPIEYGSMLREAANKILVALFSIISIGLIAIVFYQDYASLFRNNRQLRDQLVPVNYIYAGYSYFQREMASSTKKIQTIGGDAKFGAMWSGGTKKVVSIIVVGETARAANFSLNGYTRKTNPYLEKQDIVNFENFYSCGTATAFSVPCMFSNMGRKNYDATEAKYTENLLDVLQHAGIGVLWRDNNSGCKGVCDRVSYEDVGHLQNNPFCNSEECFDRALLDHLQESISAHSMNDQQGVVIVLHQHGSHGPDYFRRVPDEYQQFNPVCHTNQLQECTQEEIINTYDNTILYTDYTLSLVIDFLKDHEQDYDASLFYVSDHGESLGENNLYLHGLPYAIAPDEQKHVPALFWMSKNFADRFQIDKTCLKQQEGNAYSQDNLFHSMLGLLNIETVAYDQTLDLFYPCHKSA